jgi:hypothetical protein
LHIHRALQARNFGEISRVRKRNPRLALQRRAMAGNANGVQRAVALQSPKKAPRQVAAAPERSLLISGDGPTFAARSNRGARLGMRLDEGRFPDRRSMGCGILVVPFVAMRARARAAGDSIPP